jgi:surface antigen
MLPTASWGQDLSDALLEEHSRTGTHTDVTATSITVTGDVTAANFIQTGGASSSGWTSGLPDPDTITYNGNRSYDMVFNSTDITDEVSAGMRFRTTRTVAAPTQCADLELGSTQYFNKTSPAGTTFTDDFCAGAWVKLESYPATGTLGAIVSRTNNTSGWMMWITDAGQVILNGHNAAIGNYSRVISYQSVPLNKWVHISAQLDMSAYTATSTTSYIMIDGISVPAYVARAGTNPTALIQAGDLEVGAASAVAGADAIDGKLAQVFYSSAKITQANMQTLMSQGLTPALITTHSIVSAYSLDNSLTDLNTTSANNLTAQGGALATATDSPFGGQASGSISSTLDYAIIQKTAFSTDTTLTVQVPEGCTLPTSGGITSVEYSTQKAPYGMPVEIGKWAVTSVHAYSRTNISIGAINTWTNTSCQLQLPAGSWKIGYKGSVLFSSTVAGVRNADLLLYPGTPTNNADRNNSLATIVYNWNLSSADVWFQYGHVFDYRSVGTMTLFTLYGDITSATGTETIHIRGDRGNVVVYAENAYL